MAKSEVNLMPDEMKMSGELPYTIDVKGRMSFPQRFRDVLGDRFILTRGADHRLVAYSEKQWNELRDKISLMREGKNKEILKQIYIKGAIPVETDKLGRILVPQALREYARLLKDVYVVGAIETAEIWDKSTYEEFTQSISPDDLYAALEDL
ncbi:MAG: cell division/cell wall cluster transcriptional repressor MraZ [Oscillospiraceae bacterium]|nr:cell division/cell wall cluster transcriptional repressor MraZ [Oscillospiraceae bacterium]